MIISSFHQITNQYRYKNIVSGFTIPKNTSQCDIFEKNKQVNFSGLFPKTQIITDETEAIESSPEYATVLKEIAVISKEIKSEYDKEFGENNWEYVSIGRSCSLIAEALKFRGINTHIIPISNLSFIGDDIKKLTKQKGFPKYRQFIYDEGLNPEDMKKSGKTYVFQDFTSTGNTMRIFKKLILSPEMNLPEEQIKFESINDFIEKKNSSLEKEGVSGKDFMMNRMTLQHNMYSHKFFMSTKKLPCDNLEKIEEYQKTSKNESHLTSRFKINLRKEIEKET